MTKHSGHVARQHGTAAEQAVKDMFELYEMQGKATAQWTYPPGRVIRQPGKPPVVIYTGGGVPDVSAIFNIGGTGLPVWFDVKTTTRYGRVLLSGKAYRQYINMLKAERFGGKGFFVVLWRHAKTSRNAAIDEWRIHMRGIEVDELKETLTLTRNKGILVPCIDGCRRPYDEPWDTPVSIPDIYKFLT